MQNQAPPPSQPNSSRPGFLNIDTPLVTVGVAPHWMMPPSRTGNKNIPGPFGSGLPMYYQNLNFIKTTTKVLDQEYQTKSSQLAQSIEDDLTATRLESPTDPLPPVQSIIREMGVLNTLTQRATAEFHNKTATANSFFGGDPFNRHINDFMQNATRIERYPGPNGIAMQAWINSYRAAHDARLLSQTLQSLNQRSVNLQQTLSALQATEKAELAAAQEAAQLTRLAEQAEAQEQEQARIATLKDTLAAAEMEAETAEQLFESEQARLHAEMEQQIEQIQKQLEAERQTLELRLKVINTATAVAQQQAQVASLKIQQLKARQAEERQQQQVDLEAYAEAERRAEQARLNAQWRTDTEARWQSPTFANSGSAAFGPAFTGSIGAFSVTPTTTLTLRAALRTAVTTAIAALSTATTPVLVGFAALLAPSRLGNGDLYSLSVPLSELASISDADLYELAATGNEVKLPVRLGAKTIGNRIEFVVASTDGITVPADVPVRLAHFDAQKNIYVSGSTSPSGPIVTWTPLADPQNSSTDFPLIDTDLSIYEGATVTPDTGRIDPFPELDRYGFGGFITVFPIDSGIPPTFTMFRDRRQDPGIASGTGQLVSGNWLGAAATQEGAPIPMQIADKLRGREFSNFKAFRRAFWKTVAADPDLNSQLSRLSKIETGKGLSAKAPEADHVGKKTKYELHHVKPISEDGEVYNIDNIRVLGPKQHIKSHSSKGEN